MVSRSEPGSVKINVLAPQGGPKEAPAKISGRSGSPNWGHWGDQGAFWSAPSVPAAKMCLFPENRAWLCSEGFGKKRAPGTKLGVLAYT